MANSEESRPQKKRKVEVSPPFSLLSSLPDEVALNCVALTSRWDHEALSLTSKRYRSLLTSHDLYKIRSLMGRTETCVYVCLRIRPVDRWYILRRRKNLDADLIPILSLPSRSRVASSVVVLDSEIYVIGGSKGGIPTCEVWVLDCRTHTWRIVPSMGMARANAAAGVIDGKIYVLGGFISDDYSNWVEVFDPKTQTWDSLPLQKELPGRRYIHDSVVWDQKLYAVDGKEETFYYSPCQGKWGRGNRGHLVGNRRDWCMIDNLLFCISKKGSIHWYDPKDLNCPEGCEPEGMYSKEVLGLDSLKRSLSTSRLVHFDDLSVALWQKEKLRYSFPSWAPTRLIDLLPGARLTNCGPNIVLFWDVLKGNRREIWCAELSFKRLAGEIWGNIEWSNALMNVDPLVDGYELLYSASVTL
ncbi:F-box/kelch-repeat protein SKIP6 [Cardamine amara subsp. amara]|uniref:F-box/kelch-repeat protein SKIP6 n=1 Tax=Cardamine amara subsp. amara TaxID=228776 RepID=A0ABD1AQI1_CARAN